MCQAWAEASGAYIPGKDKPDLSTWKRNFRSALNRKEGLRLAEDRSKDPFDPHKVYEFLSPGVCKQAGVGPQKPWDQEGLCHSLLTSALHRSKEYRTSRHLS